MSKKFDDEALEYHREDPPGKISVTPTKPLANQRDLALAYSPGVAAACKAIQEDTAQASQVTARSNLVAVITNGTAVLGLGDIGPLAAKPVMEGKGVLFKKFAGIDVFDLEINEKDPNKLVDIIASMEPSFGGINLEDIKAPECFEVEGKLRKRLNIPVFHDDQHGTAIIVAAALQNGLEIVGKQLEDIKVVTLGAGAAAQGCLNVMISMGLPKENILVIDRQGVIYKGRPKLNDPHKRRFAVDTTCRTLADAMQGADVFLGLSGPGIVTPEMIASMAESPMVFALANPVPEIMPEAVKEVRPDALMATGRSDYPNQVNNVLCFPYIFRGALDVGATEINDVMKLACARAIADLAKQGTSDIVMRAYADGNFEFGPDHLIPKPFDPRLSVEVSMAAARAAIESGVATRNIADMEAYRQKLSQMVFRSGLFMKPYFERARIHPKRVLFPEGAHEAVLRAVQDVVDEGTAIPVLMGNRQAIAEAVRRLKLRIDIDKDLEIVESDHEDVDQQMKLAYQLLSEDRANAIITGVYGQQNRRMQLAIEHLGLRESVPHLGVLKMLVLNKGTYFLVNTFESEPNAEQVAGAAMLAAQYVKNLGITPRLAFLSNTTHGSGNDQSRNKMFRATQLLADMQPDFEFEGEVQADVALMASFRDHRLPDSRLTADANILVMPSRDASNIAFNMVKVLADGIAIGPILLGLTRPVHVVSSSATARRIVNMTALAVMEAQDIECEETGYCVVED